MSSSQSERTLAGDGGGDRGKGLPENEQGRSRGEGVGSKLWNLELTYLLNVPQ